MNNGRGNAPGSTSTGGSSQRPGSGPQSAVQCSICFERYSRPQRLPMLCSPCGHTFCRDCIDAHCANNRDKPECPMCRERIQTRSLNRSVIDLMESGQAPESKNQGRSGMRISLSSAGTRAGEVLIDRSEFAFYVIDNSGSMGASYDGKVFLERKDGTIRKRSGVTRWEEARAKTMKIARYNVARGMKAAYYLLNPRNSRTSLRWEEGKDFVEIDPSNERKSSQQLRVLEDRLLDNRNVRGSTPLHRVTEHFHNTFANKEDFDGVAVCFNVITDGNPDDKDAFENSLIRLCQRFSVFLVINLCTDNDEVVNYYNLLDTRVGKEASGMDVIDDLEAEGKEIRDAGNHCFTYSLALHTARMAGCYSQVADLMDEVCLNVYQAARVVRELLGSPQELADFDVGDETSVAQFRAAVRRLNRNVYDFHRKRMRPLISTADFDAVISYHQRKKWLAENWQVVVAVVVLVAIAALVLGYS